MDLFIGQICILSILFRIMDSINDNLRENHLLYLVLRYYKFSLVKKKIGREIN